MMTILIGTKTDRPMSHKMISICRTRSIKWLEIPLRLSTSHSTTTLHVKKRSMPQEPNTKKTCMEQFYLKTQIKRTLMDSIWLLQIPRNFWKKEQEKLCFKEEKAILENRSTSMKMAKLYFIKQMNRSLLLTNLKKLWHLTLHAHLGENKKWRTKMAWKLKTLKHF